MLRFARSCCALLLTGAAFAASAQTVPADLTLTQIDTTGITQPIAFAQPNDGTGRMFIVSRTGNIYIYRIATNECLTFLQKKKRRFFLPIGDVAKELAGKLDSGNNISGDEIQLKLQKALLVLPDKQRAVFNMKYFDDMSYEDISEVTNTSVGALKASYHHAVKKIEEFLNHH